MNNLVIFLIVLVGFGFITILTGVIIYITIYIKELRKMREEDKFGPR